MKKLVFGLVLLSLMLCAIPGREAKAEVTAADCAVLDDPKYSGKLSLGLELRLNIECGRMELPLGSSDPGTFSPATPGADRPVNNTAADVGSSTTQSETTVAVRPSDGRLCAGWNDSQHYANSPFNSFNGFAYSADNGLTWLDAGALPPIAGHRNYGDPDVDYRAQDGKFYYVSLDSSGLAMHISSDSCQTFAQHSQVHVGGGDDKELMAIDNWSTSPHYGRIYVAWTDFAVGGYIRLVSSDDGINWSAPVDLHPRDGRDVQGAWPTVAPNGDVYVGWVRWNPWPSGPIDVEVVRSTNGGASFSSVTNPLTAGVNPRDATATSRCGRPALKSDIRYLPSPQLEVDQNGVLHVVYSRDPDGFNMGDVVNVYYRRSTNSGNTWGTEVRLNDDSGTQDQFFPSLAVTRYGGVAVYWYDRRNDANNVSFSMYRVISKNGGITWSGGFPLSDVVSQVPPILPNFDPVVASCYMGDYNEADADTTHAYMIWSDNRNIRNGHPDPDVWFDKEAVPTNPCAINLVDHNTNCEGAITFVVPPSGNKAVAKVNLNPAVSGFDRAVFSVEYGGAPSGHTVNIGDSSTNDGFGGDAATQSNDAETHVFNTNLGVYGNDSAPAAVRNIMNLFNAVTLGTRLTLDVKNNFLGFGTGELRSQYLYALAGQPDTEGPVNYDIFAGFNRSISNPYRTGVGVTQVTITLSGPPPPPPGGGGGGKDPIEVVAEP